MSLLFLAREMQSTLRDSLERVGAGRGRRLFVVAHNEDVLALVDESSEAVVNSLLTEAAVRAGISAGGSWEELPRAVAQASSAQAGARIQQVLRFEDLMADTVLGLLTETRVADLARLRLGLLMDSPDGLERLKQAAVWLRMNGAWEPAGANSASIGTR